MRRVICALVCILLLSQIAAPMTCLALDEEVHAYVVPTITGEMAEDGTYTSPVAVTLDLVPGDFEVSPLEVSWDGEHWYPYDPTVVAIPLNFLDGTHTLYWRYIEWDADADYEYGQVSFTVVCDHAYVVPTITGEMAEDGTYTSPVAVTLDLVPGDFEVSPLEVSWDGEHWYPYDPTVVAIPLNFLDGTHTVYWRYYEDDADGLVEYGELTFTVDIPPASLTPVLSGTLGENGWYTSDVSVSYELVTHTYSGALVWYSLDGLNYQLWDAPIMLTNEGVTTLWYRIEEFDRPDQPIVETLDISIDKTAPLVFANTPFPELDFLLNMVILADWSSIDSVSGIAYETGTVARGGLVPTDVPGRNVFVITVADNAGNITTLEIPYDVYYSFSGFEQPINEDGTSVFNLGSNVPVKFTLTDAPGEPVRDAVAMLSLERVSSVPLGTDGVESSSLESELFESKSNGTYQLNLRTRDLEVGAYRLSVLLDDGSVHSVVISLQ